MKKMFYKHMVTEDTFKKLNFEQIEDDDKLYTVLGKLTHKEFNFALLNFMQMKLYSRYFSAICFSLFIIYFVSHMCLNT